MQNTDVKQTKNQPLLFQRHSIRKFLPQENNSVELWWHKNYNMDKEHVCMQTTQLICQENLT